MKDRVHFAKRLDQAVASLPDEFSRGVEARVPRWRAVVPVLARSAPPRPASAKTTTWISTEGSGCRVVGFKVVAVLHEVMRQSRSISVIAHMTV